MNSEFKAMPFQIHHNAVKGAEPWDDEPAYDETRFRIVSAETGEILDDAQGYGYKTAQKLMLHGDIKPVISPKMLQNAKRISLSVPG